MKQVRTSGETPVSPRSGGACLVETLEQHDVQRVFCVPGESYLPVLDALYDSAIEVTVARHEGGACMMAEAWAKLTNEPGICFVTRGPGATNASAGIHVAQQDSTPLILFVGQVPRHVRGRDAFQEIDYVKFFGDLAKWAIEISDPDQIPTSVHSAWQIACSGRPGPVVIALPEDVLACSTSARLAAARDPVAPASLDSATVIEVIAKLEASATPIAILGGGPWSREAREAFTGFAERFALPVTVTFRRQELFDHQHPNYAGELGIGPNPELLQRVRNADVVLVIGDRLSEITSQAYTLFDFAPGRQSLIHIHPEGRELGRTYSPVLGVVATPTAFCAALKHCAPSRAPSWQGQAHSAHTAYERWSTLAMHNPGRLQLGPVMDYLNEALPDDAIVTNGGGNYTLWIHRYYRFRQFGTQLAPQSGSMGYGLPAAIAAKLRYPDRVVVCVCGDGCLQMTLQELGTVMDSKAAIIILCIDNGLYGTIRMHQERRYPGRAIASALVNPDFAALARAYNMTAETIIEASDFAPALDRGLQSNKASLLHLKLDPDAITPTSALSDLGTPPR